MNLTRRNILKALGIGAAVSVSGASIAKPIKWKVPKGQMFTDTSSGKLTHIQPNMKLVAGKGIKIISTGNTINFSAEVI